MTPRSTENTLRTAVAQHVAEQQQLVQQSSDRTDGLICEMASKTSAGFEQLQSQVEQRNRELVESLSGVQKEVAAQAAAQAKEMADVAGKLTGGNAQLVGFCCCPHFGKKLVFLPIGEGAFRCGYWLRGEPSVRHAFFPLWLENDAMPAICLHGGGLDDGEDVDALWACGQVNLGEVWPFGHCLIAHWFASSPPPLVWCTCIHLLLVHARKGITSPRLPPRPSFFHPQLLRGLARSSADAMDACIFSTMDEE